MNIRKDDQVEVITGDDKGTPPHRRIAKVLRVLPEKNKIVVEGVNRVYKHLKPSQQEPAGRPALQGDADRRLQRHALLPDVHAGASASATGSPTPARSSATARSAATGLGNVGPVKPARAKDASQEARQTRSHPARRRLEPDGTRRAATTKDDRTWLACSTSTTRRSRPALADEVQPRRTRWRSPSWRRSSSTWASAGPPRTRRCWRRPSTA